MPRRPQTHHTQAAPMEGPMIQADERPADMMPAGRS